MLDLAIRNGFIVDVKNKKFIQGDVGIKDGIIQSVGTIYTLAKTEIDAQGMCVSPGFIDIHMHEEDFELTHGTTYDISERMALMGVTTAVAGNCGNNRQHPRELEKFVNYVGSPINYMSCIGNNFLRKQVGNIDPYAKSTKKQIEQMRIQLYEAVEEGAVGVSFGLEYCPGTDTNEAIEICKEIQGRDNLFLTFHYRKDAMNAPESLMEMVYISRNVDIPLQIAHISSLSAYGNMQKILNMLSELSEEGLNVMADAYPYAAFSSAIGSAVFDEGCFEAWGKSYDSILLTEEPYKGMLCSKDLFYKARKEYPQMIAVAMVMNEDEIVMALQHPLIMVGSDGLYRNHSGHPRGAGTFPRILGKYTREDKKLNFFDAINKMTLMPAQRIGIHSKGQIAEGFDADIVIFNKDTILDQATFEHPQKEPIGIEHVIVNGNLTVKNGEIISYKTGKYLKKTSK
ncbi:MAG: amidohydrolase family protein [Anaerovorax sp.]|nr:amidohydrolase family protein [Anaerovorax sp.]